MFPTDQELQQLVVSQHPELGNGWRVRSRSVSLGDVRASPSHIDHRANVIKMGGEVSAGQSALEKAIEEATVLLEPPSHCVFVQLQRGPFAVLATVPSMSISENPEHWTTEQQAEDRIFRFESILFAHARFGAAERGRGPVGTEGQLINLLADLRHWCEAKGIDTRTLFDKSFERFMLERHGGLKDDQKSTVEQSAALSTTQQT